MKKYNIIRPIMLIVVALDWKRLKNMESDFVRYVSNDTKVPT
ncbi:hypothetical protein LJR153_003413 [Paenibacillus sp. LjRoot153]